MKPEISSEERQQAIYQLLSYMNRMSARSIIDSMDWIARAHPELCSQADAVDSLDDDAQRYRVMARVLNFRDQYRHMLLTPPDNAPQPETSAGNLETMITSGTKQPLLGDRVCALHKEGKWALTALRDYATLLDQRLNSSP